MSKFWHHFVSDGRGGQACAALGIEGHEAPVGASRAERFGLSRRGGVEVWRIEPGSPAEKAGILEDDLILSLAGHHAGDVGKLCDLVKGLRSGAPVEVVLLRGEARLERRLVLGERRASGREAASG